MSAKVRGDTERGERDAGFERATYIALVLVFLTAVIGVGQIFYWIAGHTGVLRLSRIR